MTGWLHRVLGVVVLMAVSCGGSDKVAGPVGAAVAVPVSARQQPTADAALAGQAVSAFGLDLFTSVRSTSQPDANVTVSPASVALALAMLEPGAVGSARAQFRDLLHIDDPVLFHASMNALESNLESRVAIALSPGDDPGEVVVRIADAAYLQRGYPFQDAYLEAVGSNYGAVLNEVDFGADPDAVAHAINAFVAEVTNDRIAKLVADGAIAADTVLALVNALYLKASWLSPFVETATTRQAFTRLDGAEKKVQMMHGFSDTSSRGDGWIGATKSYVGGLTAQFILPDEGRFDEIATDLDRVFADYNSDQMGGAPLGLPRFTLRFAAELSAALTGLGLTAPYAEGGLLGIANDPQLVIDQVIHQTFVAINEAGTEAAAATVVLMRATGAPTLPPAPVVLDRPFIYRIIDDQSGATLFIGQVLDPLG